MKAPESHHLHTGHNNVKTAHRSFENNALLWTTKYKGLGIVPCMQLASGECCFCYCESCPDYGNPEKVRKAHSPRSQGKMKK